jgi:hypothetical protein
MLLITVQSKTKQWIVERKQLTLFSRDSFLCLSDNTCCINEIYFSLWSETHPSNSKDEKPNLFKIIIWNNNLWCIEVDNVLLPKYLATLRTLIKK